MCDATKCLYASICIANRTEQPKNITFSIQLECAYSMRQTANGKAALMLQI